MGNRVGLAGGLPNLITGIAMKGQFPNPFGRPKAEKTGRHIWVPATLIETVQGLIAEERQRKQQAKQAKEPKS